MRIDQLLGERGLATSRSQAQRLIAAGVQWRLDAGSPWKRIAKNGDEVPGDAQIELLDTAEARYVSRGGLKLEGALKATGLQVAGLRCMDIGQSTGGFTDCLLQHGAAHVVGVDVGSNQVHPNIRADERVTCIEGVNARELERWPAGLTARSPAATATASFLSGPASGPMNEWKEARYGHERSRDAPGREGHHRGASASEF
jgi:23S rRNA (cytidine1920-2'-O)/16S rRNA (cytidine1409-2'-O)-methyltransferase